jgi:hypothetical protein
MSRFLRGIAIFIATAGGLLNIVLSLLDLYEIFGGWAVVVGLLLLPFTWAYFPFYALVAHGSWNLLLITYGSLAVAWFLLEIVEKVETPPQVRREESPIKPVVTKKYLARAVMLLVGGLILVAVISARTNSAVTPIIPNTGKQSVIETKNMFPSSTPTQSFLSLKACVTDSTIHIRRGPGTQYEGIGGLRSGTCMWVLGRNKESNWVYVLTEDNKTGWVAAWLLTIEGDVSQLSVRSVSSYLSLTPTITAP